MIQLERLDDRVDIVRPQLRVIVCIARLVRETVSPHIQRDQSICQARIHLKIPLERAL
jgi:hypothetical protein